MLVRKTGGACFFVCSSVFSGHYLFRVLAVIGVYFLMGSRLYNFSATHITGMEMR